RDPLLPNQRLGTYTNFTNLLDLCAIAVPAGFKAERRPVGVTLLGPALADRALWPLADRLHRSWQPRVGATTCRVRDDGAAPAARPASPPPPRAPRALATIRLAVVGAHLRGQPLHHQLVEA